MYVFFPLTKNYLQNLNHSIYLVINNQLSQRTYRKRLTPVGQKYEMYFLEISGGDTIKTKYSSNPILVWKSEKDDRAGCNADSKWV